MSININCGLRITHVKTGISAEVSYFDRVATAKMRSVVMRILRRRLWADAHIALPPREVARYEFAGDGYREFEMADRFIDERLKTRAMVTSR